MFSVLPTNVYGAGIPPPKTLGEQTMFIPSLDRGAPYFEEGALNYRHESQPWVVGRAFDQVPPLDIAPVRISLSVLDGNKKPAFYVVVRGRRVGVLLDSAAASSFTNGVTDGHKFKAKSQLHAVQEFNRLNALGDVKICQLRLRRPQVVITANWRVIVGVLALIMAGYMYLLIKAAD